MKINADIKQILQELEFDEKWFTLGFVSAENLKILRSIFKPAKTSIKNIIAGELSPAISKIKKKLKKIN